MIKGLLLNIAILSTLTGSTSAVVPNRPWGTTVPRGGSSPEDNGDAATPLSVPSGRGGAQSDYVGRLEAVKSSVLQSAGSKIEELRRQVEEEGVVVQGFGSKCDTISVQALEEFSANAPDTGDDAVAVSVYDRKLEEVEAAVDAPLQVLYLRQLTLLREEALQRFRAAVQTTGSSEYEAMLQADAKFARDAEDLTRDGSDWDYSSERNFLQTVMTSVAESGKKATDIQLKSAQTHQTAMQFLQSQQQMIQQLQMQLYGQTSPWNVGVAYRIPDTNFNIQGSYQSGKGSLSLSCVPDEYAPFLGPNGFTSGVGPGNLGLSLNLSI